MRGWSDFRDNRSYTAASHGYNLAHIVPKHANPSTEMRIASPRCTVNSGGTIPVPVIRNTPQSEETTYSESDCLRAVTKITNCATRAAVLSRTTSWNVPVRDGKKV